MSSILLAVPSANPGGLEAGMGMHFGHCDLYTLVEVEGDARQIRAHPAQHSASAGRLPGPVQYLADNGVTKLLAGGMGMRPLMGFQQMGIEVLFAGNFATVGDAVNAYLQGKLPPFTTDFTCRGGH